MDPLPIVVGVIGAGKNTRGKHIPLLLALPGVTIRRICNRSPESALAACREFNLEESVACSDPSDIFEDSSINAVVIGTWPYRHREFTVRALEAGKHVLTEARMAMDATEAAAMLEASKAHPELIAQVVPSPFSLGYDAEVARRVESDIGTLLTVQLTVQNGAFPAPDGPLSWRHVREYSGNNIMGLGIYYEALMRWLGDAATVMAHAKTVMKVREETTVDVPDVLILSGEFVKDRALYTMTVSTVLGHRSVADCWMYGTEGTIHVDFTARTVRYGAREGTLEAVDVPETPEGRWRVEEEFVNSIRGVEKVTRTDFHSGVRYMQFTDAVHQSLQTKGPVNVNV